MCSCAGYPWPALPFCIPSPPFSVLLCTQGSHPSELPQQGSLTSWLLIGLGKEKHLQETGEWEETGFSFAPCMALAVPLHSSSFSMTPAHTAYGKTLFAPCP